MVIEVLDSFLPAFLAIVLKLCSITLRQIYNRFSIFTKDFENYTMSSIKGKHVLRTRFHLEDGVTFDVLMLSLDESALA